MTIKLCLHQSYEQLAKCLMIKSGQYCYAKRDRAINTVL